MKKKLLVILMILVIALTAIVATACTKNQERDFKQVTASVTYANRTAQVDKLDLNATIYNFVYQYYSYYQQGYLSQSQYQSVIDNIDTSYKQANESLAETEAYTLKCLEELYQLVLKNGTDAEKAAANAACTKNKEYNAAERIAEIESVLPKKDLIAAIEAYNEEMQTSFDSFLEAYESEIENAASKHSTDNVKSVTIIKKPWKLVYEKGETLNESALEVGVIYEGSDEVVSLERSEYTVTGFSSDEVKEEVEVTVTFANKTATFNVEIVAAKTARPAMPKDDEEEEEEKTEIPVLFEKDLEAQINEAKTSDSARYKALSEAKRRLEKQMSTNYRSYEYYYLSKLKTQVVTAYEEIIGKTVTGVTQAEIIAEYEKRLNEQKQELIFGTKEYTDIAEDESGVKSQIVHVDGQVFYVQQVLLKITDDLKELYTAFEDEKVANQESLLAYRKALTDQSTIYASNVEYDKDATCEDEDCKCTACVNYKGETPGECTDEECECVKCPNKRFVDTITYGDDQTLSANEDGTFDILDLVDVIYADLAVMTDESTDAERVANLATFKKWIYTLNEDDGMFSYLSDGKVGYNVRMDSDGSYVKDFLALPRLLAYGSETEKEAATQYKIVGSGVGSFGICYTEYGIHVIMLSGYALPAEQMTEDNRVDGTDYYALPLDTIVNYSEYKPAENNDDTVTPVKGTLAYEIVEKIESEKKEEAIGNFKKDFYRKALKDDTTITYYEKVYKDLIEQYQD